jgi:hypothetical protein
MKTIICDYVGPVYNDAISLALRTCEADKLGIERLGVICYTNIVLGGRLLKGTI